MVLKSGLNSNLTAKITEVITGTFYQSSDIDVTDFMLKKNGSVVTLAGTFTWQDGQSGWKFLGTLPTGFIPSRKLRFMGLDNTNNYSCLVEINTNGAVYSLALAPTTSNITQFTTSYIVE